MTLDDARYLIEVSKAAGCRVHFKQLGTGLAIQRGVYAVGRHRAKGGSPDQWPEDLNIREWPDVKWAPVVDVTVFTPKFEKEDWKHYSVKKNDEIKHLDPVPRRKRGGRPSRNQKPIFCQPRSVRGQLYFDLNYNEERGNCKNE
jgi:hypothetical protein